MDCNGYCYCGQTNVLSSSPLLVRSYRFTGTERPLNVITRCLHRLTQWLYSHAPLTTSRVVTVSYWPHSNHPMNTFNLSFTMCAGHQHLICGFSKLHIMRPAKNITWNWICLQKPILTLFHNCSFGGMNVFTTVCCVHCLKIQSTIHEKYLWTWLMYNSLS